MKNKEEILGEYFGCDPAYYPEQEVEEITRALEMGYRAKETEIQELIDRLKKSKGKDLESVVVNPFEGAIKALKSLL